MVRPISKNNGEISFSQIDSKGKTCLQLLCEWCNPVFSNNYLFKPAVVRSTFILLKENEERDRQRFEGSRGNDSNATDDEQSDWGWASNVTFNLVGSHCIRDCGTSGNTMLFVYCRQCSRSVESISRVSLEPCLHQTWKRRLIKHKCRLWTTVDDMYI